MPSGIRQPQKADFAVLCVRLPNNALVAAECTSLTGGVPDADGFALCQQIEHIPQAAYVHTGLHILAYGSTLDSLLEAIAQRVFEADEFRIDFRSLSQQGRISPREATLKIADSIPFYPNLNHPKHHFLLIERDSGLWFGEIMTVCKHTYRRHDTKPYNVSSSLPNRQARALVNLVRPQANSLLDPCCGTGSILLEAQLLGLEAFGSDQNKRMVGMARQNLKHFGYDVRVEHADARTYHQTADALVTNLPYGRFLQADESLIRTILEHGMSLVRVAVYVAGYDISDWLASAGYCDIEIYPLVKHDGFARYVHKAQVNA